jgi:hypothetical protein
MTLAIIMLTLVFIEDLNGVTTHLPNGLALKMDGAEASDLNSTISANAKH